MNAARVHVGRMYLVEYKAGTIALMLAVLCISGTWPAIMRYLEQRGRQLQHTYLDYSISNLLVAVIFALTFGQVTLINQLILLLECVDSCRNSAFQ
ncbi:hypothetical protein R1flu_018901 [Riccia fluitans]|uniref:Uncharacterized protein n=1 Tax=Riccia fluitans TaxID=41844 RepID=A0ABD1ZH62_9MARC